MQQFSVDLLPFRIVNSQNVPPCVDKYSFAATVIYISVGVSESGSGKIQKGWRAKLCRFICAYYSLIASQIHVKQYLNLFLWQRLALTTAHSSLLENSIALQIPPRMDARYSFQSRRRYVSNKSRDKAGLNDTPKSTCYQCTFNDLIHMSNHLYRQSASIAFMHV